MYYENKNSFLSNKQLTEMRNIHQKSIRSNTEVHRITEHTFLTTAITLWDKTVMFVPTSASLTDVYWHMGFPQATNSSVWGDSVDIRSGSVPWYYFCAHTAPAGCGRTGSLTGTQSCSHCNTFNTAARPQWPLPVIQ